MRSPRTTWLAVELAVACLLSVASGILRQDERVALTQWRDDPTPSNRQELDRQRALTRWHHVGIYVIISVRHLEAESSKKSLVRAAPPVFPPRLTFGFDDSFRDHFGEHRVAIIEAALAAPDKGIAARSSIEAGDCYVETTTVVAERSPGGAPHANPLISASSIHISRAVRVLGSTACGWGARTAVSPPVLVGCPALPGCWSQGETEEEALHYGLLAAASHHPGSG